MSNQLTIRGVPDRVHQDGWWLAAEEPLSSGAKGSSKRSNFAVAARRFGGGFTFLALLVLIADFLFWEQEFGISLPIFAMVLSAAMLVAKPGGASKREWATVLGLELICNLPLIEQVQALSVMFSLIGVAALAAWIAFGRLVSECQTLRVFLWMSTVGTVMLGRDTLVGVDRAQVKSGLLRQAAAFLLPVSVGLVFLLLLTFANPILEDLVAQFVLTDLLDPKLIWRAIFWVILASLIWPYLNLDIGWQVKPPKRRAPRQELPDWSGVFVNAQSVRNSLVLFNLLFLVQTVMDLTILTGGVALPDGMTYAAYAHRGAYPLVATALLAGAFATATRHMIGANRLLRGLVFLWLGQNMVLVLTAAFRLSIYVEAYALTNLRLAAFIWMGLVLVGLLLTLVQIVHDRDNAWLIRSNLLMLGSTLYLCCFVNFAQVIAGHNLSHQPSLARLDKWYICRLGPQALPAIHAYEAETGQSVCGDMQPTEAYRPIKDWREWGFRRWRLDVYLATETAARN